VKHRRGLNSRLSKRKQVWIDVIGFALFLTPLCLTVLWLSMPVVLQMLPLGRDVVQRGRPDPLARLRGMLPLGFILLLLQGLSELIKRIAFLCGQGPDPMGRLTDKTAEAELIEALRLQAEVDAAKAAAEAGAAPRPQH
jgi:TRAP-type mannitol/chloroaromatic compound transport system permease small subunit